VRFVCLVSGAATRRTCRTKPAPPTLNTGIAPFTQYDFIDDFSGQTLTMMVVPEPATLAMLVAVGMASAPYAMHRQRSRRHSL